MGLGSLPRGVGHVRGCRGSAFWDCTGLIMGYSGEGKEWIQVIWGGRNMGKIEAYGDRRGQLHVGWSVCWSGHAVRLASTVCPAFLSQSVKFLTRPG